MGNVNYKSNFTADTGRNRSENLWGDCPLRDIITGEIDGVHFYDDFVDYNLPATQTSEVTQGRYKAYNTGSGQWIVDAMPHSTTPAVAGGIISNLCDTDGDAAAIGTQACPFLLDTTATGCKLWFEARVATTSILTNMGQWFVGLCENGVVTFGAATPLANANATASTPAMIGFNRLEDGLAVLNTSYADHAAAWTDVQASAYSALAANTWIKLGMKFDPDDSAGCVRFYVNGVETTTPLTKTTLAATTHLDAKCLGPCMAFFADSAGTSDYVYLDWWRCAQLLSQP